MPIINQVVSGGGTIPTYIAPKNNVGGYYMPDNSATIFDFNGASHIRNYALFGAFQNCTNLTSVLNTANIVEISSGALSDCFNGCTGLAGMINFSNLNNVSSACLMRCFKDCTGITGINISSLQTTTNDCLQYCFSGCSNLVNVISGLTTIGSTTNKGSMEYCFENCTSLVDISFVSNIEQFTGTSGTSNNMKGCFSGCTSIITGEFDKLNKLPGQYGMQFCFKDCTSLQSLWFYALDINSFGSKTNQFNNMLQGVTGCTVHFPMAIQSTIGSWSDVTNGFGGTNTTILFDLVTSLTGADSNTYTRSEKDSTSTATAWVYNDTLYYTSGVSDNDHGVNEPSVSDAIYSDAACTQSVTTITAIA